MLPMSRTKKTISSSVETNMYNWKNHNITVCYTKDENIYINITSNISYKQYEGYIILRDLSAGLKFDFAHTLITKAFNEEENYNIAYAITEDKMNIEFTALLGGFLTISQFIELNEKKYEDGDLTLKIIEMETRYSRKITELEQRITELNETISSEEIIFATHPTNYGDFIKYPVNAITFDFTRINGHQWLGNYMDFNKLKFLKNIIIDGHQFEYIKNVTDVWSQQQNSHYNYVQGINGWQFYPNSLQNIFDSPMIFLPSVETIKIFGTTNLPSNTLRSLPNLKNIIFENYNNNQLNTFELIQNFTNIQYIQYTNCLNIQLLDQIRNWCLSKNIRLEIN